MAVDMIRVGRSIRALRIHRQLRQVDVAARSGVSRSQVARIERGETARLPLSDVSTVAAALGANLDIRVRWRGEQLDRLLDGAHAELVERVLRILAGAGWSVAVEVSFALDRERGVIDVLATHPQTRMLLVVEVKSVVPDLQAMLGAHDRKTRLAPTVSARRGWVAAGTSRLLVLPESTTVRRRLREHEAILTTAYPVRGFHLRRWLRGPQHPIAGLLILPSDRHSVLGQRATRRQRVRPRHGTLPEQARGSRAAK